MQRLEQLRLSQPQSPIIPLAVSTHHPSHRQPLLAKIMSSRSTVTTAAATHKYPSPLNTPFLLTTGDYNQDAAGTPWFKSSLFPLLPFLQISSKSPPTSHELLAPPTTYDKCSTRPPKLWPTASYRSVGFTRYPTSYHTATCSTHTTILLAHPVAPSTGLHATTRRYQGCLTLAVVLHTFLPGLCPTKQHSSNAMRGTNRSFTAITTNLPSTQTSTQLV